MKKLLVLLSALALTFTLATAEGKCGTSEVKTEKQCQSCEKSKACTKCTEEKTCAECVAEKSCSCETKKEMKCQAGKCGGAEKKAPKKGKCGQGKCG